MKSEHRGVLVLDDKSFFLGKMPFKGKTQGEICFNTGMTGYQEVITDPSYTNQIITFTFPHIGNTGYNHVDVESGFKESAKGIIVRNKITNHSSYRVNFASDNYKMQPSGNNGGNLIEFLEKKQIPVIYDVDTRIVTAKIRSKLVSNCIISSIEDVSEIEDLLLEVVQVPKMSGMELSKVVSANNPYTYHKSQGKTIVVIDYGVKENILRILSSNPYNFTVEVVPFNASFEDIIKLKPAGVLLSNGPGDPRETLKHTGQTITKLAKTKLPIFGICLGHQLLCGLFGASLIKLPQGHRGINQPVINYETGNVEITPQNHGFACSNNNLPSYITVTHRSLFDGVIEGIRINEGSKVSALGEEFETGSIFAVQYHPEGSSGPHDSKYLFDEFLKLLK